MPTYEYRCPAGHDFEHFFRSISTATATLPCPTCGAEAERRLSPGGGLLFKGSGFYITDYGKDGKKDQRRASDGAKSDGKSADTSSESKTSSTSKPSTGSKGSGGSTE
ncbi:MAG TPA: zinc ribbon domain-containing protein [Gemmatimonadaceae bacterium]